MKEKKTTIFKEITKVLGNTLISSTIIISFITWLKTDNEVKIKIDNFWMKTIPSIIAISIFNGLISFCLEKIIDFAIFSTEEEEEIL